MTPELWNSYYSRISADLGFSMQDDYLSSLLLSGILGDRSRLSLLHDYSAASIMVVGNAASMPDDLARMHGDLAIVADSALPAYMDLMSYPEIVVTDLDGNIGKIEEASAGGSLLVVHAHGDNMDKIRKNQQLLSGRVLGTTQNSPLWNIYNFYGFTDGDRAAFLADYLGAEYILLAGFDFEHPNLKPGQDRDRKVKKLKWARKLLQELASERGKALPDTGSLII